MTQEGVQVEILNPICFHLVEIVLDISTLLWNNLVIVRWLNGDRVAFIWVKPWGFIVSIGIHFNEIASCKGRTTDVCGLHFGYVHSILIHFHLVAELVTSFVFTVEQYVNRPSVRRIRHFHTLTEIESQQVTHEGLVAVVVEKRPFLGFGRSVQHPLLTFKLDTIRLLGESAWDISTLTDSSWFR